MAAPAAVQRDPGSEARAVITRAGRRIPGVPLASLVAPGFCSRLLSGRPSGDSGLFPSVTRGSPAVASPLVFGRVGFRPLANCAVSRGPTDAFPTCLPVAWGEKGRAAPVRGRGGVGGSGPGQGVTGTWSVSRGQRAIRRPCLAEAPATLNCFSRCPGRCAAAFGRSGRKGSCPFIAFPRAVKAGAVCAQTRLFGLIGETWNPRRGPSPGRDTGRLRLPGKRRPKGREPRWPTGTRNCGLVTSDRCPHVKGMPARYSSSSTLFGPSESQWPVHSTASMFGMSAQARMPLVPHCVLVSFVDSLDAAGDPEGCCCHS